MYQTSPKAPAFRRGVVYEYVRQVNIDEFAVWREVFGAVEENVYPYGHQRGSPEHPGSCLAVFAAGFDDKRAHEKGQSLRQELCTVTA